MRFNGSELRQMGCYEQNCSKQGLIYIKEKEGKLWNKSEGIMYK